MLTVGYVDEQGALGDLSNYGDAARIAAPGKDILGASAIGDRDTELRSGTSVATALVSGMATLLSNAFPRMCPTRVYDCLVDTAVQKVKPNSYGNPGSIKGGIADLKAAYECMATKQAKCPIRGLPACVDHTSGMLRWP